jgi:hydrogenase nickel incorporation protein HypA/HybF
MFWRVVSGETLAEHTEMHELSIALSMIEMAKEQSARRGDARVIALHLKLGPLSGVVKEALTFSFEIACQGTVLEEAKLIIEEVPVAIHCPACGEDRVTTSIQDLRCPECGDSSAEVVKGRDLEVVALELEEVEELVT